MAFVEDNDIEVLNVAGSRGSRDPALYGKVYTILEGVICVKRVDFNGDNVWR
jgi:hypothetical protein